MTTNRFRNATRLAAWLKRNPDAALPPDPIPGTTEFTVRTFMRAQGVKVPPVPLRFRRNLHGPIEFPAPTRRRYELALMGNEW